jgi:broad specificity phosphatase PhoE
MTTLYLVRHGKAAGGFGEAADPGLDDTGHSQAAAMAAHLTPKGPLALVSSPLQRARETAAPLARAWSAKAAIEPRVAEIPSPTDDLAARAAWLHELMDQRWDQLDAGLVDWRQGILDVLASFEADTVVVTHFMVINAAVGAALGDDRLVVFRPDNCSETVIECTGAGLRLIARGKEAETRVG